MTIDIESARTSCQLEKSGYYTTETGHMFYTFSLDLKKNNDEPVHWHYVAENSVLFVYSQHQYKYLHRVLWDFINAHMDGKVPDRAGDRTGDSGVRVVSSTTPDRHLQEPVSYNDDEEEGDQPYESLNIGEEALELQEQRAAYNSYMYGQS